MTSNSYDSIVIGAGSAGLAYAQTAASLGASILLIERADLGGTCVNRGCVPKKILWAAGEIINATQDAASEGIATESKLDFRALVTQRDGHISKIRDSFSDDLSEAGITVVRGQARLDSRSKVTVDGTTYQAKHVILAAGGRPTATDIPGHEHLATSDDVLAWCDLPKTMVVSGGGYIGCEFAAIFRALGCNVTLLHKGERLLEGFPAALADHVLQRLGVAGVDVVLEDKITKVLKQSDRLSYETKSGDTGATDVIINAIGRTPNIDQLGPLAEDLRKGESGALAVDDRFQTSVPGLYAIGDIADRLPLTPVATADGTTLAHILYGDAAGPPDLTYVATTAFVYPPAAYVGTIGDEPLHEGTVTPLPAQVLRASDGPDPAFYQLHFDGAGRMQGAAIAAEGAENMIAFAAAMLASGAQAESLVRATAIHPSFSEEFFSEV